MYAKVVNYRGAKLATIDMAAHRIERLESAPRGRCHLEPEQ
jgi:hypothetical protein